MAIESKGPKISCDVTDQPDVPEWATTPNPQTPAIQPAHYSPADTFQRAAQMFPTPFDGARLGVEGLFADRLPIRPVSSISPLEFNPSSHYLFIPDLNTATLVYGKYLGTSTVKLDHGKEERILRFEIHQKFPNGSEFIGEVTSTEDGKSMLFVPGTERFIDQHEGQTLTPTTGFTVEQKRGESGKLTLKFGAKGTYTLTESIKLSAAGFLIPDPHLKPVLKTRGDHKGKRYLLESTQSPSLPTIVSTETVEKLDPERGRVKVDVHFLSDGQLIKIVQIEKPQPDDSRHTSLLATPQTNAFGRVAVRTLPLTSQIIPLGTVYAPDRIKLDATQQAVPFSQLAILYDSQGAASLVPASLSPGIWSGTKEIGNLHGILKPNGKVALTPTTEQLGKLMTHPPEIGVATTIDLHGTIGNLTISPLAPLRIQGTFQIQDEQRVFIPEISQHTDDQRINVFVYDETGKPLPMMLEVSIGYNGQNYDLETYYGSDPTQTHVYQKLRAPFQNRELVSIGSSAKLVNDRLSATQKELDQNPEGELIEASSNALVFRTGRQILRVNVPKKYGSQELTQIILESPNTSSELDLNELSGTIIDPLTKETKEVTLVLENGKWLIRNEQAGQRTVHELHYDSKAERIQLSELLREEIALIPPTAEPVTRGDREAARELSSSELAGFDHETAALLERAADQQSGQTSAELVPANVGGAVCEATPAISEVAPSTTPASPLMTSVDAVTTEPPPAALPKVVEIPVVHFGDPSVEASQATLEMKSVNGDSKTLLITLELVTDGKKINLSVRRVVQPDGLHWSYQPFKATVDGSKAKRFDAFPNKEGQGLRLVLPDGRQLILSSESIRKAEAGYRGAAEAVPTLSCDIKDQLMIAAGDADPKTLEAASWTAKAIADQQAAIEAARAAEAAALLKPVERNIVSIDAVQFPNGESFGATLELLPSETTPGRKPGKAVALQKKHHYRLVWTDSRGEHTVDFDLLRRGYQEYPFNAQIDKVVFSGSGQQGRPWVSADGAILLYPSAKTDSALVIPPELFAELESEPLRSPSKLLRQVTIFPQNVDIGPVQRFCGTSEYQKELDALQRVKAQDNIALEIELLRAGISPDTIALVREEIAHLTGDTVGATVGDPLAASSSDLRLLQSLRTLAIDDKKITLPITTQDGAALTQSSGKLERMGSALVDPKNPNIKVVLYKLHLDGDRQIAFTVNKTVVGNRANYELVTAHINGRAISKTGLPLNFENLPMGGMEFKLPHDWTLHLDPGVLDHLEDGETSTNIGYVTLRKQPKPLPVAAPAPTQGKARVEKAALAPVCEAPPVEAAAIAATPATSEVSTPPEPATNTAAVCIAEPELPAKPVMTFNTPLAHDIGESTRSSRRTSIQLQMLKEEKDGDGNYRYSFRLTLDNGDQIDFQGSFGQTQGESPSRYFKLATSIYSAADGSAPTSIRGYVDKGWGADDITVFPLPGNRTLRVNPHALDIAIVPQPYHQENIGSADSHYLSIIDPSLPKEIDSAVADPAASGVGVKVGNVEISKEWEGHKVTLHLSDGGVWILTLSTDGTIENTKILSAYTEIDGRRVFLIRGEGKKSELTLTHPKTGLVASFYPWQLIRKFERNYRQQDSTFAQQIKTSQGALPNTTPIELQASIVEDLSEIVHAKNFETVHLEETGRELPYDPSSSRTYRFTLPATGEQVIITGKVIYRVDRRYYFHAASCQLFPTPDSPPIDITSQVRTRGEYAGHRYSLPLEIPIGGRSLRILPGAFHIASGESPLTTNSSVIVIYKPPVTVVSGTTSTEAAPMTEDPRPALSEAAAEPPVCAAPANPATPATPEETPPPLTAQSIEPERLVRPEDSKVVITGVTYGEGSTDVVAEVAVQFKKSVTFSEKGIDYSNDTFVLYLNETEGVEIVVRRKIAIKGRMYAPISAIAYSSNPEEIGELKIEVHSNSFTLTLKDGGRIKLLPGLLVAAIHSPGKPTSKPLVNILMPEENPATLICKEPPPVPPLEADKPDPTPPAVKPERTKASASLLYATEEGLIEARRRIAEHFGINPELLYLPPDPEHSFPGMRIEPTETGGLKVENEDGTLHSYTYRKEGLTLKVYFAPREVRGRMRSVPVRAEATYAGYSGSIPVEEVYSLEGRYHIALGGSFKGMVFYIDHFNACRELSLHKVGERIAELHGLEPIHYHPRNEYPINPTGTVLEAVDAQVAANRDLLGLEVNACVSPANPLELPPIAAGKASPGGMGATPIRSVVEPKLTPAEPPAPTEPYTLVPSESSTTQRIENRNLAAAALGFEPGIIDINLKYKDFYGVTMIGPEEVDGNSVYSLGKNFTLRLKIDKGKTGQILLPVRNLQATYYGEAIPVTQFTDQNHRTWIKFGGRLEGVVWIFDPFSVTEYEAGKYDRPRFALIRASHPELMNQLEAWAGHDPSSLTHSATRIDLNKPADRVTFLGRGLIAQLQRSEAVVKELSPASSVAVSEESSGAVCEAAATVEPTQLTCEPEAEVATTTPVNYPEVVRQLIAQAETALRDNIRGVMVSTDKELSKRSAKINAAISLINGHPYHPVLQRCIFEIQNAYSDPGRKTSILWNFLNEFLSHSNEVSFNAPGHADAIEKLVSRAIGRVDVKEEADHKDLATLKERAAEKEKEAREEMTKLIEEMLKEKR